MLVVLDVVVVVLDDVIGGAADDRTPLLPEDERDDGATDVGVAALPFCALPVDPRDPVAAMAAAALTIPEQSEPQLTP